jgi:regulator of protease activity HflC (stomatin/prohibitin superfamily)
LGESKVIAARAEVDAARLMRQAADILASKPAMQIRQLEALQVMAKSANSKVIFVPMSLVGDGGSGGMFEGTSARGGGGGGGPLSQPAILNSLTDV